MNESQASKEGLVYLSCYMSSKAEADALATGICEQGYRAVVVASCSCNWIVYGEQKYADKEYIAQLERDKQELERKMPVAEKNIQDFLNEWETLLKSHAVPTSSTDLQEKCKKYKNILDRLKKELPDIEMKIAEKNIQDFLSEWETLLKSYGVPTSSTDLQEKCSTYQKYKITIGNLKTKVRECQDTIAILSAKYSEPEQSLHENLPTKISPPSVAL